MGNLSLAVVYPTKKVKIHSGDIITLQAVRPADGELIKHFSRNLSSDLKHQNYMQCFKELAPCKIARLINVDYKNSMTLLALHNHANMVGMVHYTSKDGVICEFDAIVTDEWQHKGLGTRLAKELISYAKTSGIKEIQIILLYSNLSGIKLAQRLGFSIKNTDEPTVELGTKQL